MELSTSCLGFGLSHPFIAGASPLGFDLDTIKRLEDNGCSAIVIPSLFEEQITLASQGRIRHRDPLDPVWAPSLAHFPQAADYALAPDEYAEHICTPTMEISYRCAQIGRESCRSSVACAA